MPTRLYFRNEAHTLSGTLPSTEQSTATANWTATGATTLKTLSSVRGGSQVNHPGTSQNTTATQSGLLGCFVSEPLAGAQTVGGGTIHMNVAESEGNNASNFWINALHVFVWRPSTGALVGTVRDSGGTSLGGTEPTSANSVQVTNITGITSSAVSAQTGDVVVVEVWARFTQSMGTAYASTFYFGGTTENTTENAVVTNHAAFVELAENLVFQQDHALAGTLAAAVSGSSTVTNDPLSYEMVGAASGVNTFTMPAAATVGDVAVAMAFRDGSTTPPSLPAGWTSLGTATNTSCSALLCSSELAVDGTTWALQTAGFGGSQTVRAAFYGGGQWVAAGNNGELATSPDSITWTQRTSSFETSVINAVAYGGGLWVAVGDAGKLATSSDGVSWTQQTSGFDTSGIQGVAYGNGLWVAVGGSGKLATSPDGATWTLRTSSFGTSAIGKVAYGNGLWVACGLSGKIATSPDGTTWTQQTSSFSTSTVFNVAYGGGIWVAVGDLGKIATSPDGTTWTQQTSGFNASENIRGVAYYAGLWVAVGASGQLATSPDGTTWTQQTSSFGISDIWHVATGLGSWVIAGDFGKVAISLVSPSTFTNATAVVCNIYRGLDPDAPLGMVTSTTGTGTSVTLPAVANAATSAVASFAGHASADVNFPTLWQGWTQQTSSFGVTSINAVAFGGGLWVAVAGAGKLATSPDGITWTQRTSSFGATDIYAVAYNGSMWVAVGGTGKLATSTDGTTWTQQTSSFGTGLIHGVFFGGGQWVAVGGGGLLATSPNGTAWTQQTSSFGTTIIYEVFYGNGLWVAAGDAGALATSTDATTWTQQTTGFGVANIRGLAYGGGLWVAASATGLLATSPNGVDWTQRTSSFGGTQILEVAYGNGEWVATGGSGTLATSLNGIDWTQEAAGFSGNINGVWSRDGQWVAVGASGELAERSPLATIRLRATLSSATNEAASYDSGGAVP